MTQAIFGAGLGLPVELAGGLRNRSRLAIDLPIVISVENAHLDQALRDAGDLIDAGDLDGAFRFLKRLFDQMQHSQEYLDLAPVVSRLLREAEQRDGAAPMEWARTFRFSPTQTEALQAERQCAQQRAQQEREKNRRSSWKVNVYVFLVPVVLPPAIYFIAPYFIRLIA